MNLKLSFLILFFIVISVNLSYSQYDYLEKCINDTCIRRGVSENTNFNLFDSIKKFEDYLMKSKLLKDRTQKSYNKLIKKDFSIQELKEIKEQIRFDFPFFFEFNDDGMNELMMYNNCPSEIVGMSLEMSNQFYPVKKIYDKIIAEGYPKSYILQELSEKTDFCNKISRLMLCNLVYRNWLAKND